MADTVNFDEFRELLLARRAEIVEDSAQMRQDALVGTGDDGSGELSSAPIHLADRGSDTNDQEFTLERLSSSSETLQGIDDAH